MLTHIRAKKEQLAVNIFILIASLMYFSLILNEVPEYNRDYTMLLSAVGMVAITAALGSGRWVSVSREKLLNIMENQISRDPEAIKIISKNGK